MLILIMIMIITIMTIIIVITTTIIIIATTIIMATTKIIVITRSTLLFVVHMWQHKVGTVLENETSKIVWDTDHVMNHHCPDIVLIDKVDKRVKIIDIAVPWDANIESKYE